MEARAQARFARHTPRKARRVVDLIRGLPASEAQAVLQFAPQAASETVYKVLSSAIANAEHNHEADIDELKVARIEVDAAPVMKRFHARAKGRGNRISKPTCHIFVTVGN